MHPQIFFITSTDYISVQCFMCNSRSPRPVFTKQQEQTDDEEGLLEKSIERQPMYFRYSGGQKSESSQYDFTFH